jgi:hypothetical protein
MLIHKKQPVLLFPVGRIALYYLIFRTLFDKKTLRVRKIVFRDE